jgi:hypothetical protein
MPEGMNVEIAHKLSEHEHRGSGGEGEPEKRSWLEYFEYLEVAVLAVVAIATAWSGYQAARWDGQQAYLYGVASRQRVEADSAATLGGQQKLLDVSTFNTWIQAREQGDTQLAAIYVKRFSQEYKVAFDAWLKTHPFTNPNAPPGPTFMPEYHNADSAKSDVLNAQATESFNTGTDSRETADRYVRQTVLFATVLFLIAVGQRFKYRGVRVAALIIAATLMTFALVGVVTLPRI